MLLVQWNEERGRARGAKNQLIVTALFWFEKSKTAGSNTGRVGISVTKNGMPDTGYAHCQAHQTLYETWSLFQTKTTAIS